jgi:hypothetical protein
MTNKEKAELLYNRHLKFVIEWGGTNLFTNASDMSVEGVASLLDIMTLDNREEINQKLTKLVQNEYEREQ